MAELVDGVCCGGSPVACSLDSGELTQRLERIARICSRSQLGAESDGRRHSLSFRDDARTRAELEALIADERQCCSFLEMKLDEGDGVLVLTIDAPGQAA